MTRLAVLLALLLALGLGACGGSDDDGGASSSTDVNDLLTKTFTGSKDVKSGNLDLKMKIEAEGGDAQLGGPVTVSLAGPFQAQGDGQLPKFDLDAAFEGGGQSIKAGATSTGDKGYLSFQGTDYVVDDQVFRQFKAGFEQAQKQSADKDNQQSLATLGIDPRRWLTDAKNAGEAKVGDTDTIKITGDVDVPKLLDDVDGALERVRSLGLQGSEQLPKRLTDEEKRQTAEAVDRLDVEIYTGADDRILRRMVVGLGLKAPEGRTTGGAQAVDVRFDLQLLDVNEDQEIDAPEGAKPFEDLASKLGGLGLGGLGGGSGSGSGSGGAGQANLEKYSKCIQDAGGDEGKIRKCADLLATP